MLKKITKWETEDGKVFDTQEEEAEDYVFEQESQIAAQQVVQFEVPESIEQMAVNRYKVVPSHESMFHRWAVVAGNGTQQLYIGREVECLNVARKFAGAFLDGAFVAMQNTAHHAETAPVELPEPGEFQCRLKPDWDDKYPWTDWKTCTPESASAYLKNPTVHDWTHEVRKIYTEQQVIDLLKSVGVSVKEE